MLSAFLLESRKEELPLISRSSLKLVLLTLQKQFPCPPAPQTCTWSSVRTQALNLQVWRVCKRAKEQRKARIPASGPPASGVLLPGPGPRGVRMKSRVPPAHHVQLGPESCEAALSSWRRPCLCAPGGSGPSLTNIKALFWAAGIWGSCPSIRPR